MNEPHYFIHLVLHSPTPPICYFPTCLFFPILSDRKKKKKDQHSRGSITRLVFPPLAITMASILGSQGVVLATAMAVSGTVILLAHLLQKSLSGSAHQLPVSVGRIDPRSSPQALRSCISSGMSSVTLSCLLPFSWPKTRSFQDILLLNWAKICVGYARKLCFADGKKRSDKKKEKKKKRVHFAEDVVDPIGYSEEFKRQHGIRISNRGNNQQPTASSTSNSSSKFKRTGGKVGGMPANRMALYSGIIRDRVVHRLACSYWWVYYPSSFFFTLVFLCRWERKKGTIHLYSTWDWETEKKKKPEHVFLLLVCLLVSMFL